MISKGASFACVVSLLLHLLLFSGNGIIGVSAFDLPPNVSYPAKMTLRAAVMTKTVPLAYYDATAIVPGSSNFPEYRGFQPDLLRELQGIAQSLDNVTLLFQLEEAPPFSYTQQFEYLANDCTSNCSQYDLVVGDYYGYASRSMRAPLTPPLLSTAGATLQYTRRKKRLISTLEEAHVLQEPVCLLRESFYDQRAMENWPHLPIIWCQNHTQCIDYLKQETCALFVEDELQLRYSMVQDAELEVTRERFLEQYIVWPLNARLDPLYERLLIRWIYEAKGKGVLDNLYNSYFDINYCPIGRAGDRCQKPCSPSRGLANREGHCVCESTKWTGDDCSIEVQEDTHLIPYAMSIVGYAMISINVFLVVVCAIWTLVHHTTAQVKVAQPLFLGLVLLGCLISTSTIWALQAQDEGNGPVPACMAIPWLYSVGFSVTFGTLFAKIRRVYLIFKAAAHMQRLNISVQETIGIIGVVLVVDVTILTLWTLYDPLQWERTILLTDQFDHPLSSQGMCTCDHWLAFVAAIALLHFTLLVLACYLCYASRDIPPEFSKSKYVALAMISNLQIFIVGVPILVILGNDPETSFFVRSVIIWINDFVVVTLIFGSLIWAVHCDPAGRDSHLHSRESFLRAAMQSYIAAANHKRHNNNNNNNSNSNTGSDRQTAIRAALQEENLESSGQDQFDNNFDVSNRLFSTFEGNNNTLVDIPESNNELAGGGGDPTASSTRGDETSFHVPADSGGVPASANPPRDEPRQDVLMVVSESSQPTLRIDMGNGQMATVPITRIKFDGKSLVEKSAEFDFDNN